MKKPQNNADFVHTIMKENTVEKNSLTVTEYISILNSALSNLSNAIVGEISELSQSARGHVYFSLKDKYTSDILPCVIWSSDYSLNGINLKIGMEVLVKGKPNFYGPFGKLSFQAKSAELVGEGALKKAYDALKLKLEKEGLFLETSKKKLPRYPEKIGVITSATGAVVHDFVNNLGKYGYKIKIMDTRVEGQDSGRDLILSLRAFKKEDIDILILIRGGGSMQSLAGFDNETLVREIANFPVPIIAGIGHHQDVPLAALVADRTASTPSIVANIINSSWQEGAKQVEDSQKIIFNVFERTLEDKYENVDSIFKTVESVFEGIFNKYKTAKETIKQNFLKLNYSLKSSKREMYANFENIINKYESNLVLAIKEPSLAGNLVIKKYKASLGNINKNLENLERLIEVNNPERQLKLGYSIIRKQGKIIKNIQDINIGDKIDTQLSNGNIQSEVNSIK